MEYFVHPSAIVEPGANATFTNDSFPRSKRYPQQFIETLVRQGASIGTNATILPGITIGQYAMVGVGSVVTHDVPPNAVIIGNPAKIINYVTSDSKKSSVSESTVGLVL